MSEDANAYYKDLYASEDDARRAGWRHRLEQALRYEVAIHLLGASWLSTSRLLDVGCGPGGLHCYLEDTGRTPGTYLGIDPLEDAVSRARERSPSGHFERRALEDFDAHSGFDAVVAIGALVDGVGVASHRMRRQRIAAFFERLIATGASRGVLIVLEQGALDMRTSLAAEDALFGLYTHEVDVFLSSFSARYPSRSFAAHAGFLQTDLAICWHPATEGASAGGELGTISLNAVIEGPWAEDVEPSWLAWLCLEAGEIERASGFLVGARESPRVALLRERIALLSGT